MRKITLATALLALATTTAAADVVVIDNNAKIKVDCAKDKTVTIVGNSAQITLTGACDRVTISGNKANVKGSVGTALVSGNDNTLELDAVDEITVSGNKNTVSFKKGLKAKLPKVANTGTDNKLSQGK